MNHAKVQLAIRYAGSPETIPGILVYRCSPNDSYMYSFFPLAIVQWNALPENVATSLSLDSFKAAVGELQDPKP